MVLVVAPHADDEVLGCGGVITKHANSGDTVHVLVVTRGDAEMFPDSLLAQIRAELQRAHAVLGVASVTFLDFPAPKLVTIPAHVVAARMRRHILRLQPDSVFLPHRGDIHNDHRACYWAALVACRPHPDQKAAKLLCYETLSETEWGAPDGAEFFVPNVFVDISCFLGQKLKAMSCYESQLKQPPHSRSLEAIEALAKVRGAAAGVSAAEAFMLIREIC